MKSETQIKIIQNRQKYFQEIKSRKVEEIKEATQGDEIQSQPDPTTKPRPEPEFDLGHVLKDLIENLPAISMPAIVCKLKLRQFYKRIGHGMGWLSAGIARIGITVTEALDRRTEKIRSRLYTYMLLLFDA